MSRTQHVNFTITQTLDGSFNIALSFVPKMYKDEEEFKAMSVQRRHLQNAAMKLAKHVQDMLGDQIKNNPLPPEEKTV